ncbi:MAG: hypothetical protein AABZ11_09690 [Nitrospinota bacterium]
MKRYILETPHTKEECLRELDEIMAEGKNIMDKFYWGCGAGDHTGYSLVDAESESEVWKMVPGFIRNKAKIVELSQYTPEQIRSFH